jgi:hypothetical protein
MWARFRRLKRWQRRYIASQLVLLGILVELLINDRVLAGLLHGWSLIAVGALALVIAAWIGRDVEEDFVEENPHLTPWMDHDESWWTRSESTNLSVTMVLAWRMLRRLVTVLLWPIRRRATGPR